MDQEFSLVAIERLVMSYAAQRWDSALLVRIDGDVAIGLRGHGDHLGVIEAITLPLTSPCSNSKSTHRRLVCSDVADAHAAQSLCTMPVQCSTAFTVCKTQLALEK